MWLLDRNVNTLGELFSASFWYLYSPSFQILRHFKNLYFEIAALIPKIYQINFNARYIVPADYTYIYMCIRYSKCINSVDV